MSVKVKILYNNSEIKEITLRGHANFSIHGNDIVCAAISSIFFTTIMYMEKENLGKFIIKQKKSYCSLRIIKHTPITRHLIKNMIYGLTLIEEQYPKNINILKFKEGELK